MAYNTQESLGVIVRILEQDFISGTGTLMSKYVRTDLYEDINKIYAYLESKHISGDKDSMGRDKPFFNIVLASRNVWFRATDIDRKDIKLVPKKLEDTIGTFLLNAQLQKWMTEERFGVFLNTWGLELAGFNSIPVKFIEKDGKLNISVTPWSRIICDQINFNANPKIELLELTEDELYSRGYDKKMVDNLCEAEKARELTNKQKQDNKNNYFKIYEVHGKLPLSFLTGKESDKDEYVQQMQVLSFVATKKTNGYDEFVLYKGKEEKDPYMLTSLFPATDGSISLNGSVKNLFEAQWMENHTKKAIKDQLDLASKLLFQTADANFVGQNALSAIENGDILIHQPNMPLTQVQNNSHDISALQNFGAEWKQLSSEINGISEAMLGVAPKAGSAWRQTEALLQESHSLFEQMTENKGLAIEDMLRERILPFLKKKLDNSDEIAVTLGEYGLSQIESKYIKNQAIKRTNDQTKQTILNGGIANPADMQLAEEQVKGELSQHGNQRFFKPSDIDSVTWKEIFKDLETNIEIDVTGEAVDTQATLETLKTVLNVVVNPNFQNNPKAQLIIDKILTRTGQLSPLELSEVPSPAPSAAPPNGGQPVGAEALPITTQ